MATLDSINSQDLVSAQEKADLQKRLTGMGRKDPGIAGLYNVEAKSDGSYRYQVRALNIAGQANTLDFTAGANEDPLLYAKKLAHEGGYRLGDSPGDSPDVTIPTPPALTGGGSAGGSGPTSGSGGLSGNGPSSGTGTTLPTPTQPTSAKPAVSYSNLLSGGNLQNNSSGSNVSQLQSLLGVTSDGKFGPKTKQAVIDFQKKNGLVADGIVGPKTIAMLEKLNQGTTSSNGKSPADLTAALGGGTSTSAVGTSAAARAAQKAADLQKIKDDLAGSQSAPTPYNSLEELDKLRKEKGVVNDEQELASIQNEARVAQEQLNQFKQTTNKEISQGGYLGGISEAERNLNFRLESLSLREQAVVGRLNTKNAYISTALQAGQQDYQTALTSYNNEYNKNLQAVQLYNSELSQEKQDALTSFTTITNLLSKSKSTTISPQLSTQLDSLALQIGLPAGILQEALKGIGEDNTLQNTKIIGNSLYMQTVDSAGVPHLKLVQNLPSSGGDGLAGTPNSYKEWSLAGKPGTYADFLKSGSTPTAAQQTVATYAARLEQSNPTILSQTDYVSGLNPAKFELQKQLPSYLQTSAFQQYNQAARNFINATLRRESGAVISPSEFTEAYKQYLPSAGDSKETLKQKENNRNLVQSSFKSAAGGAYQSVDDLLGTKNSTSDPQITSYLKSLGY